MRPTGLAPRAAHSRALHHRPPQIRRREQGAGRASRSLAGVHSHRRELAAEGVSGRACDSELRARRWSAPLRGVYLPTPAPTLAQRCAAALSTQAQAMVSHDTAVLLFGWATLHRLNDAAVHLTVPAAATTSSRRGLVLHRTGQLCAPVTMGGLPVAPPARTVVDLARRLDPLAATVLADSALRSGLVTEAELSAELGAFTGRRGVVGARRALQRAQPGTRSVPETLLRLTALDAGLVDVRAAVIVEGPDGLPLAEADAASRAYLVWLEYDGFAVHSERQQFRRDRARALVLRQRGWEVVAISDAQLGNTAALTAHLRALIARAPSRIQALPWGLSPEADEAKRAHAGPRA